MKLSLYCGKPTTANQASSGVISAWVFGSRNVLPSVGVLWFNIGEVSFASSFANEAEFPLGTDIGVDLKSGSGVFTDPRGSVVARAGIMLLVGTLGLRL